MAVSANTEFTQYAGSFCLIEFVECFVGSASTSSELECVEFDFESIAHAGFGRFNDSSRERVCPRRYHKAGSRDGSLGARRDFYNRRIFNM